MDEKEKEKQNTLKQTSKLKLWTESSEVTAYGH